MYQKNNIVLVGCGGTGGFVAEGLCRLLINDPDVPLLFIDHDRVEEHNLRRQQFFYGDIGKFKSQALAERLSRRYGRVIAYSVYPYMHDLIGESMGGGLHTMAIQGLIVSCVDDSTDARRTIAETLQPNSWWLDAGNGYSSGQVLLGNCRDAGMLEGAFDQKTMKVSALPSPSLQLPSLLAPPAATVQAEDCAEAVIAEEQSPVINQAMDALILEFISQLLKATLSWMGAYLDMGAGTLQVVPAEPITIARMLGISVKNLTNKRNRWRTE